MALAPGVQLAPYEIAAQIGAGGMGSPRDHQSCGPQRSLRVRIFDFGSKGIHP